MMKFKSTGRFRISCLMLLSASLLDGCNKHDGKIQGPQTYPVFVAGAEPILGLNEEKYAQFREQNITVTNSGKIVAIVQGRNASPWSDRSGQDLICKVSKDNGETWSESILMVTEGEKSICPNASVYDRDNNRIICLYSVFQWPFTDPESRKSWRGLKNRQYKVFSDDEGLTWSEPRDITNMAKTDSVTQVFGSGEGIQIKAGKHKGRLIVPGGDFVPPHKRVFVWFSDDRGETWQTSEIVPNPHNRLTPCENSIAELQDGTLLMNERNSGIGQRWQSRSTDGGERWSPFEAVAGLPSISCNASIITVDYKNTEWVLYAGPVGPDPEVKNTIEAYSGKKMKSVERRSNGVVFASPDGGNAWPVRKLVVPDQFAYSSLMELRDETIGLFYETREHKDIMLVKFTMDWLFEENFNK
jgi:sialidase-1